MELTVKKVGIALASVVTVVSAVWFFGSNNPVTPAGYMGYLTQGAVFGKNHFYGLQKGPTSPGLTWMLHVTNVSITPYTYTEEFSGNDSVLSRDNLKLSFRIHLVWKVKEERIQEFVEKYSVLYNDQNPDKVVQDAYGNFLKEPLRMYARDEIQRLNGLQVKDQISNVGDRILAKVRTRTQNTPFDVTSVVVGNIQYPKEVEDAVAQKMAATQVLERKNTEIAISEKDKKRRVIDAEGIALAMHVINRRLTAQYLQHEAIEAQKAMVGSPNHTTIYIPVGPNGVPIVGTFDTKGNNEGSQENTEPTK